MDRSIPVWVGAALALIVLMALPLGWLAWLSVSGEHGTTLTHYRDVFADPALRRALWNTVVLAFWVGLVSVAIGAPLAWLTARTDVPRPGLIRGLVLASFVTPPFLGAFAWVMLAGPNAGVLNTFWRSATGAREPLLNIFTMPGLIFIVSIYTFPYVYIMVANTLALIASDLEEAAAILGAGRLAVARTVTLPMVLPALASGFILAVLQARPIEKNTLADLALADLHVAGKEQPLRLIVPGHPEGHHRPQGHSNLLAVPSALAGFKPVGAVAAEIVAHHFRAVVGRLGFDQSSHRFRCASEN